MKQTTKKISVLDHGFVELLNLSGPRRRVWDKEIPTNWLLPFAEMNEFDADDIDPAQVARISFDAFDNMRVRELDMRLVEYLIAHNHNTPIEMIETWWHMQMPIFIARHFVRHRTACINEVSARYKTLPEEWYIPCVYNVGLYAEEKKQGRKLVPWEKLEHEQRLAIRTFTEDLNYSCKSSYEDYKRHLNAGIPPELARSFLHVNHYTHWVWKMDLHNLMHFMALRLDSHAQYEARVYAEAIANILRQFLPETMKLFEEYRIKATEKELQQLKEAYILMEDTDGAYNELLVTVRKFFKRAGVKL